MWTRILTVSLLVLVSACSSAPRGVGVTSPTQESQQTTSLGEIWYVTSNRDSSLLRRDTEEQPVMPGERFEVSHDREYIAVVSKGVLEIGRVASPEDTLTVASKVEDFRWRPGSHDLLYLVKDEEKPYYARWYLRRENGAVSALGDSTFQSLVLAALSPDGKWLAYYHAKAMVVVSLADGKVSTLSLRNGESAGVAVWVGSEHLSVESGTQIFLLHVPSGERSTYVDVGAEMTSYPIWTLDGNSVAVRTKQGVTIYRQGNVVSSCEGVWIPVSWSPNGQYLLLKYGNVVPEMKVHVLDTSQNRCNPELIPDVHNVEVWHPSSSAVVLTTGMGAAEPGMLQLWGVSHEGLFLLKSLDEGVNPRWVKN